jgi:hypothetical protein
MRRLRAGPHKPGTREASGPDLGVLRPLREELADDAGKPAHASADLRPVAREDRARERRQRSAARRARLRRTRPRFAKRGPKVRHAALRPLASLGRGTMKASGAHAPRECERLSDNWIGARERALRVARAANSCSPLPARERVVSEANRERVTSFQAPSPADPHVVRIVHPLPQAGQGKEKSLPRYRHRVI